MRNLLLNLLLARLTAGNANKEKAKTLSTKWDFKNILLEQLKEGEKSTPSKGRNKFSFVVLVKDKIPQEVIGEDKSSSKVEKFRNSSRDRIFKKTLLLGSLKFSKTTFGKKSWKDEIPLRIYFLTSSKDRNKKIKNLEVLEAQFSNLDNLKFRKHHLTDAKIEKDFKRNKLNIKGNLKVEKEIDKTPFLIGVNHLPISPQGGEVLKNKAVNLYGSFNNRNLQRFLVKGDIPKRDKNFSSQSLSGEFKAFVPLTESKVKATETLRRVKRIDYQTPIRSFQIKIPLEENLVLKIRVVRDNFYAKISGEGQTVNLLIQNLQTVAQQVANLGFSKAVVAIYTSGGSGKGFNGRQSSEDGNNKHKNAEKVAKTSDTNPNRNLNFRSLL